MGLTKNTVTVTNIADLSSTPNATEGLTAAQLQAKFDKTGADHKTYLNDTLTVEQDAINTTIESRTTSGWIATTGSYASASTITIAAGGASKYRKGDKIKLTQSTVKYFFVVAVADTVLTVTGGSDYTVANLPITDMYYSHCATPIGFPAYFNYTGVISATSGTITSGSVVGVFTLVDSMVNAQFNLTIVDKGTGSGVIRGTLPIASTINTVGLGRETQQTGAIVQPYTSSTQCLIYDMPITNDYGSIVNITYHI